MDRRHLCLFLCLWILGQCQSFNLTIVHTNDIHAHFEQSNVHGGPCTAKDKANQQCYGGYPRLVTMVKKYRADKPNNTLVLDAGDQFQGTLWFYYFGANVTAFFVNMLHYDAMALGNHDFDLHVSGLVPFLEQVKPLPVLSANLDISKEPTLLGLFHKSARIKVDGQTIGIIGYTTVNTPAISMTDDVIFKPVAAAVRAEVAKMREDGINKIIALGHAGYSFDKKLAAEVEDIDIIVGGHSHTFLYTGTQPSTEKPAGPYPTVIHQASGTKILVVQAYCYSKYIGHIDLHFNDEGKLLSWQGEPVLLDYTIKQDEDVLKKMVPWAKAINDSALKVIGSTSVFLQGEGIYCRKLECNLGNAIADGIVHFFQSLYEPNEYSWTGVAIALMNGGGIRTSVPVGNITTKDIMTVMPFRNTVDRIELKGEYLMQALEHSVSAYPKDESDDLDGRFLQFSGLKVSYDVSKPVGSRVVDVQVRCANCTVPMFEPLDKNRNYVIALPTFTANGGDSYTVIRDHKKDLPPINVLDSDVFADYIKKLSPLTPGLEGRIRFVKSEPVISTSTGFVTSSLGTHFVHVDSTVTDSTVTDSTSTVTDSTRTVTDSTVSDSTPCATASARHVTSSLGLLLLGFYRFMLL